MTRFLLLASCIFFISHPIDAQFQRILGPTTSTWVLFGESVAMHGNHAIVGEPSRDANGLIHEKVHIYQLKNDGWSKIQTLLSSAITGENDMGGRTGMSENWLAFSQVSGSSSFKYFLYEKQADTFVYKQAITHPDPWSHHFFCKTIALTDDHLIVGGAGSAYCYRINPTTGLWELKQTITKSGGTEFGSAVAIYENRAVITSYLENAAYAYEYVNDTWEQRKRLVPGDAGNHKFGANCAIYKDLIAVTDFGGVYNTNDDISKAYMYKWQDNGIVTQIADLQAPNSISHSNFGGAYYINDDFLFVGANATGSVYKFRRQGDTFQSIKQYRTPDPAIGALFGESIAAEGNQILIGDPHFGILRGAVYQTYVYDSLYALIDCQLPAQINGNSIDSTNFNALFLSDTSAVNAGKPAKFGAINVERLFTDMTSVHICEGLTSDSVLIDFTQGYNLLVPDGYYTRWTTSFEFDNDGNVYSAADILDDTTSFRPRIVNNIPAGRIDMRLEFGLEGESPCMSFPLVIYLGQNICPMVTDTVDMAAGDTITLSNTCESFPLDSAILHFWDAEPDTPTTIGDKYSANTRVFPLVNTLYSYTHTLTLDDFEYFCDATQDVFVRVTAADTDGDGFPFFLDCDDSDPLVNPDAIEIPFNGIDDDCKDGDDGFCIRRHPDPTWGVDAMTLSDKSTTNFGSDDDLDVGYATNFPPNRNIRSYLKFDLSTIPSDAIIDSAFLSLYWNPTDQSGIFGHGHFDGTGNPSPAHLLIDRVREDWEQNTISWDNAPFVSTDNQVKISHTQYPGATSDFTNMNITKLISDLINPSLQGNLGLRLSMWPYNNIRQFIFASSNHLDPTRRPKLELCWHADSISTATEVYTGEKIAIYPNPASDILSISTTNQHMKQGHIYDVAGRLVSIVYFEKKQGRVDVSGFVSGMYSIRFDDGSVRVFSILRY